jgi:hypothetical protein
MSTESTVILINPRLAPPRTVAPRAAMSARKDPRYVATISGRRVFLRVSMASVGHDAQSLGIINMLDAARCSHLQRAKIDWPLLRPCATTWAIMRQHEPLITDCAQDTVYLPINPCLSATCGADVPPMLIARADKVIE